MSMGLCLYFLPMHEGDAVLIDIPVGFPENTMEDVTRPDWPARGILPTNRKPSIFLVPCRHERMES